LQESMSEELARAVVALEFPASDHARVEELSKKARQGSLTSEEESELDWYLNVNSFLSILKAKARAALKRRNPAA
jgi:hypothetical protein